MKIYKKIFLIPRKYMYLQQKCGKVNKNYFILSNLRRRILL